MANFDEATVFDFFKKYLYILIYKNKLISIIFLNNLKNIRIIK